MLLVNKSNFQIFNFQFSIPWHLRLEDGHHKRGAAQVGVQLRPEGQPLRLPRQLLERGKHLIARACTGRHVSHVVLLLREEVSLDEVLTAEFNIW